MLKQAANLILFCDRHLNNQKSIIFMKRSANISYPGQICFPGGMFDADQDVNLVDTALREAREEIGLDSNLVDIWGSIPSTYGDRAGTVSVTGIVGEIIDDSFDLNNSLVLNKHKVDCVFSVPVENLIQNNKLRVRMGGSDEKMKLPEYLVDEIENETIWGVTGIQLNNVLTNLFGAKHYLDV